jgi:hypothetical protein
MGTIRKIASYAKQQACRGAVKMCAVAQKTGWAEREQGTLGGTQEGIWANRGRDLKMGPGWIRRKLLHFLPFPVSWKAKGKLKLLLQDACLKCIAKYRHAELEIEAWGLLSSGVTGVLSLYNQLTLQPVNL